MSYIGVALYCPDRIKRKFRFGFCEPYNIPAVNTEKNFAIFTGTLNLGRGIPVILFKIFISSSMVIFSPDRR